MTKEIPYPSARFSCHQAGTSKDEGIGESAGLTLALLVAHRRQPGTGGSDLPHDCGVLLGQQPIPGFIAHVVLGPGVHVIHIDLVAGQGRHGVNELPAMLEPEPGQPFLLVTRGPDRPVDRQPA
jgi:hypothetical protein